MRLQEVKNRLPKLIEESKAELTESIESAETYTEWQAIARQVDDIMAALNAIELVEGLLKDEPDKKTE